MELEIITALIVSLVMLTGYAEAKQAKDIEPSGQLVKLTDGGERQASLLYQKPGTAFSVIELAPLVIWGGAEATTKGCPHGNRRVARSRYELECW
ncbi:MAG: hypothetical protein JKY34_13395 [Kordiimonadaceae bacterium]|nr:hypothetical protein [Kordiimonadaceae bacterium]